MSNDDKLDPFTKRSLTPQKQKEMQELIQNIETVLNTSASNSSSNAEVLSDQLVSTIAKHTQIGEQEAADVRKTDIENGNASNAVDSKIMAAIGKSKNEAGAAKQSANVADHQGTMAQLAFERAVGAQKKTKGASM